MREDEFTGLAAAYQAELRAHCYGSSRSIWGRPPSGGPSSTRR